MYIKWEGDIKRDWNNIIPSILRKLIYAELCKAFDKVSYQRLIHKLKFSILNVLDIKVGRGVIVVEDFVIWFDLTFAHHWLVLVLHVYIDTAIWPCARMIALIKMYIRQYSSGVDLSLLLPSPTFPSLSPSPPFLYPLYLGPLNPARGSGKRCKLPSAKITYVLLFWESESVMTSNQTVSGVSKI